MARLLVRLGPFGAVGRSGAAGRRSAADSPFFVSGPGFAILGGERAGQTRSSRLTI